MSTLLATENAFGVARLADPDTCKQAAASIHITQREQDVR
jgi:hypothetical protein